MPTQVIRRPPRFVAACAPVFYTFSTDAHVQTPGNITLYQLLITSVPPSGAQVIIEPHTFTFLTSADGHDPENPFHVLLDGASTSLEIAERLASAVNSNAWLSDELFAGTPVPVSTSTNLSFSYPSPQSPQPFSALGPSGNAYTDPVNDPLSTTTFVGNAPELRENFALHLELEIEQDYRQNTDWQRLPVLRLPTREKDGAQVLDFRIDRVVQAQLGFDVPEPDATELTPALTAFRQARARYWPTWAQDDGGVIVPDTVDEQQYTFFALNATVDAYENLPHNAMIDGCPTSTVIIPELLAVFFDPQAGQLQRFLRPDATKQLPMGAKDYLAFYANPELPEFDATALPRLEASVVSNGQTHSFASNSSPLDLLNCEPEITFEGQIWLYPLGAFWAEIESRTDLAFAPEDITEVCFYLGADPSVAGDNLITGGNAGTFDTDLNGWTATDISAVISSAAPYEGAGCLSLAHTDFGATTFSFQHDAPIELLPNTTYEFVVYFQLISGADSGFLGLDTMNWGLSDASVAVRQEINLTQSQVGWQSIRIEFTTGSATTMMLGLSGEVEGILSIELDSMQLRAIGERALTQPACYTINPACAHETLLYRNSLGVAETLHFRAEPRERLGIERSLATQQPQRLSGYSNSDRGELNYANAPEPELQLESFPIAPSERVCYEELLQSTAVYRLNTDAAGSESWQPVVLSGDKFTLFDPQRDLQQLNLSVSPARQSAPQRA